MCCHVGLIQCEFAASVLKSLTTLTAGALTGGNKGLSAIAIKFDVSSSITHSPISGVTASCIDRVECFVRAPQFPRAGPSAWNF